jgi:hypothetical protein
MPDHTVMADLSSAGLKKITWNMRIAEYNLYQFFNAPTITSGRHHRGIA